MKHLYLCCILLLMAVPCLAVTEHTVTVGASADYATYILAEADWDVDLVAKDTAITIQGITGATYAAFTISGAQTDATRNWTFTTTGAARHSGTYGSADEIEANGVSCIFIDDDYVTIDGFQISQLGSASGIALSVDDHILVKNCIIRGNGEGGSSLHGLSFNQGEHHVVLNSIIYDWGTSGMRLIATTGDDTCYHSTIVDCATGIVGGYQDVVGANNLIYSCPAPIQTDGIFFRSTNMASDAASISYSDCGSGSCGTDDVLSISDPFVNRAGDNYLLAAGSAPIDSAIDVTGTVPTDIIDTSKPVGSDSDIGANERLAAAGGDDISYVRRIKEGENK